MTLPVEGSIRLTENYVGAALVNRIESRNGLHTLEHAEEIGLGSRTCNLVNDIG